MRSSPIRITGKNVETRVSEGFDGTVVNGCSTEEGLAPEIWSCEWGLKLFIDGTSRSCPGVRYYKEFGSNETSDSVLQVRQRYTS